jgi:ABC-type Mn2+/Zn2+ transport system ATPase subunit
LEALVRLDRADFGYEGRAVLRGATLALRPGEIVGVFGSNGSGKSTLLRGLLGLLEPLSGSVSRAPGLRIGYVPQRDTLDPLFPLSAFDVTLLGTYAERRPWRPLGAALRERAHEALRACRAADLARRRYAELSGGQRQRVLLARALATDPEVLLLDEPLAGIDAETERAILDVLVELRGSRGLATWIVSHHAHALAGKLDGIVRVQDGRVQAGAPA